MARQVAGRALWNRKNKQEQGLLISHPRYSDILNNKRPSLVSTVQPASLWPHLRKYNVVGESTQDKMILNSTRSETVEKLLDHVERGPAWQLHAFLRSCHLTEQQHVITHVGLNPETYSGPSPPESDSEDDTATTSTAQSARTAGDALLAIQSHRDVYNRTLMQGRLFDIPSLDLPYDMEWCYMPVVLTSDEMLQNPVDILPCDILKAKPGKPRLKTVLLSGHPGAGKSSIIRSYGHRWSQMKAGESEWDLVVILNVSTLRLSEGLSPKEHIKEAIRQSLESGGDKEAIMRSLDDSNHNILLIPDGMDECRCSTTLEMLTELISSCYKGELGFTVLATCRTGLCLVKDCLFDRRIKIDGFKTLEGVQYVQRFYDNIQKPEDDSVYDYIANNQEDLNHILTNPLCTHILSAVTADGTLKLTKGQRLRFKDLFLAMEKSMKRRQLEKLMQESSKEMPTEEKLEDGIKNFYKMSLWALLLDIRTFTDDVMDKFCINAHHPYLTFMTKTKKYNSDLQDVSYWRFNHETFLEYFAASALEALPEDLYSAFLLIIAADRKFRNTQRIMFSALGGDVAHLAKLTDMIRVNLLTWGIWDRSDYATKQIIDDIKEKSNTSVDLADMLDTLKPGEEDERCVDTSYAQTVWQTVRSLYEDGAEGLRSSGFYHDKIYFIMYECLHELPEAHQQIVFAESLGRTMPSVWVDHAGNRRIFYYTGGIRWVKVMERGANVEVHIDHSLTDAAEAVRQYGRQHLEHWGQDEDTRRIDTVWLNMLHRWGLDYCYIWGNPPHDQFLSTTLWSDLLSETSNWPVTANRLSLRFDLDTDDSVTVHGVLGFLQCLRMEFTQDALRRLLVPDEEGRLSIEVYNGHVDSECLVEWTEWYVQQDLLQVKLQDLTWLIVDSGSRPDQHRRVESLKYLEHNGCSLFGRPELYQLEGSNTLGGPGGLESGEGRASIEREDVSSQSACSKCVLM